MKVKIQGSKDPKPKGDSVEQALDHLRAMRDLFTEQIDRMEKYPDFTESLKEMRSRLAEVNKTISEAEGEASK